ncbi:hypothetical protein A0H81_09963 [Grifola frondosa]|uniref:Uncharacterized protein n=1 Tax=Grifola frondosa TaxID=5627 RepID=A0A1C7M5E3_GRIFR|nr:hypothetical protein A0H81_09963 [Grifola frondosa]
MLRNLVGVKPDVKNDDLKRYLVQSILDQSHLMPVTNAIQPILSEYDHVLRLYPLPTAVVLADKYDRYQMTYEGCHVFNPGRFVGNSFTFSAYNPSRRESEECILTLNTNLSPQLCQSNPVLSTYLDELSTFFGSALSQIPPLGTN